MTDNSPMKPGLEEEVKLLIGKLTCLNPAECDEARARLMRIGRVAVPQLLDAFKTSELNEKIQVAKVLGGIADAESVLFLTNGIRSDAFETRYAAIQGLPLAGKEAIIPLMRGLIDYGSEMTFRSSAHIVLHQIAALGYMKLLRSVLTALEGPEPELNAPLAAHKVLEQAGQSF